MRGFLRPSGDIDAFLLENVERLLQVTDAGKLQPRIKHVLPGKPHLQPARPKLLIDWTHEQHDDVAFLARRQARREAHRHIGGLLFVDAGQHTKAVAPLHAQILQSFFKRPFLPVRQRRAFETADH